LNDENLVKRSCGCNDKLYQQRKINLITLANGIINTMDDEKLTKTLADSMLDFMND
jgi:hypothetical protein